MIRDTSTYKPFRKIFGGKTPSLKNLSARMLGVSVQQGEHSSVQDAQAAMRLYTMHKKEWEKESSKRNRKDLQKILCLYRINQQNIHPNQKIPMKNQRFALRTLKFSEAIN